MKTHLDKFIPVRQPVRRPIVCDVQPSLITPYALTTRHVFQVENGFIRLL
jgi:hypothetical protein